GPDLRPWTHGALVATKRNGRGRSGTERTWPERGKRSAAVRLGRLQERGNSAIAGCRPAASRRLRVPRRGGCRRQLQPIPHVGAGCHRAAAGLRRVEPSILSPLGRRPVPGSVLAVVAVSGRSYRPGWHQGGRSHGGAGALAPG